MISGNFEHCKDLEEFYSEIHELHEKVHGKEYCHVHDEISQKLQSIYRPTYKELGINQGATLACAIIRGNLNRVFAYDRNLTPFKPYEKLFKQYWLNKKWQICQNFVIEECDSVSRKALSENCDVLYIDTTHTPSVLRKELEAHAPLTLCNIICHDTYSKPDLQTEIERFVEKYSDWEIETYYKKSVGFTTLTRKKL